MSSIMRVTRGSGFSISAETNTCVSTSSTHHLRDLLLVPVHGRVRALGPRSLVLHAWPGVRVRKAEIQARRLHSSKYGARRGACFGRWPPRWVLRPVRAARRRTTWRCRKTRKIHGERYVLAVSRSTWTYFVRVSAYTDALTALGDVQARQDEATLALNKANGVMQSRTKIHARHAQEAYVDGLMAETQRGRPTKACAVRSRHVLPRGAERASPRRRRRR